MVMAFGRGGGTFVLLRRVGCDGVGCDVAALTHKASAFVDRLYLECGSVDAFGAGLQPVLGIDISHAGTKRSSELRTHVYSREKRSSELAR